MIPATKKVIKPRPYRTLKNLFSLFRQRAENFHIYQIQRALCIVACRINSAYQKIELHNNFHIFWERERDIATPLDDFKNTMLLLQH